MTVSHTDCHNASKEIQVSSPVNVEQPLFVTLTDHHWVLVVVKYGGVDVFLFDSFSILIADTLELYMSCVMRTLYFYLYENKDAYQQCSNCTADQHLCFRNTVQSLFFLNPKFQASSLLLQMYRLVCVGPGWKPELLVFSCKDSIMNCIMRRCIFRVGLWLAQTHLYIEDDMRPESSGDCAIHVAKSRHLKAV